jgi:outer membrane protein OmpA-like peptidoglycan-associated protein
MTKFPPRAAVLLCRTFPLLLLLLIGPPRPAHAQVEGVHATITPYGGWSHFDSGSNLKDKPVYGARLGVMFGRIIGLEGTYGWIPGETNWGPTLYRPIDKSGLAAVGANVQHFGLDAMFRLPFGSKLSPYVVGGYQQISYDSDLESAPEADDDISGPELGVGLIGWVQPRLALRAEVRDVMHSFDQPEAEEDARQDNIFFTVGIQYSMGGRSVSHDMDGDGVPDDLDACAGTPLGARVDVTGCPIDGDKDGVPDGLDNCENTPRGATVDAVGCPSDADKDGVPDGIDKCPDTAAGLTVDATGCSSDSDRDGVADGADQCANTPTGARVDAVGCPLDEDKDGVPDGLDKCPGTAVSARVDKDGCEIEVSEKETELLDTGKITIRDINFETAKWTILPDSYKVLDEVGSILVQWPELRVEIGGHADHRGSNEYNLNLSQKRAQAVLDYLTGKFPQITAAQYTAKGYGESQPVAPNTTVEGMARNRRVEFKVLNTEVLKKERERRRTLQKGE